VTPLTNATQRCHSDPEIDAPRQWFHYWGDLPTNIPDGAEWKFDAVSCGFALVGTAVAVGGIIETGGWSAWLGAIGTGPALAACIPVAPEEPVTSFEFYRPGNAWNSFPGGGMGSAESTTEVTGEICERSFTYRWTNTRNVQIETRTFTINSSTWTVAGNGDGHARFPSGGTVQMRGTEPCICRHDSGSGAEFGLDCASFPPNVHLDQDNGWVITDNSKMTANCDYRGCECGLGPASYTGELPPEPCGSGSGSGSGEPPPPPPPPTDAGVDGGSASPPPTDAGSAGSGSGSGSGSGWSW
jgi:hypothetical protein